MLPLQRYLLRALEKAFAVFGLLMLAKALPFLYRDLTVNAYSISEAAAGNASFQAIMGGLFAIAAVVLAFEARRVRFLLVRNKLLGGFLLLAALSLLWSDAPDLTLRRGIGLLGASLFGVFLVVRFSREELIEILATGALIIIATTVLAIVMVPETALDTGRDGALRGLYTHKNDFGAIMVLCAIALWVRWRVSESGRLIYLGGLAVSIAFIAMSSSRTSWLVAVGLFLIALPLLKMLRTTVLSRSLRYFVVTLFGVGGFVLVVAEFYVDGLSLIGRDLTLTNRTFIWQLVIELGSDRWLLGYGFGAFWDGSGGRALASIWQGIGHSHNGYMDIWIELGVVGLALFAATSLTAVARAVEEVVAFRNPTALFFPLFLFMVLVQNIAARAVPEHSTIEWALFVAGMLYASLPEADRFGRRAVAPAPFRGTMHLAGGTR